MSGETISTAIITIASVLCAAGFVAAVYPSILAASDPVISSTNALNDQIKTDVKIIHEAYSEDRTEVYVWVKNIGSNRISLTLIGNSDIFFGEEGNFIRIPYDETGAATPGWQYLVENSGAENWGRGDTIKITITTALPLTSGKEYFVKFITYNGVLDEDYFTVS